MVVSIPPKYFISSLMGYLKGKLALKLFQQYRAIEKRYWGRRLWARGHYVNTTGLNEEEIRKYVKWQKKRERD
jgi:putative transposase